MLPPAETVQRDEEETLCCHEDSILLQVKSITMSSVLTLTHILKGLCGARSIPNQTEPVPGTERALAADREL